MANTKSKKTVAKKNTEEADSMLQEFFLDELKDIYWAEKNLVKALTKMEKESTTEELKQAFATHRGQTEEHVEKVERIFEILDEKPVAKKCEAMSGLIEEANSVIEDTEKGTATRDVALIVSAQKAEHYEIAAYGSLKVLANVLGYEEVSGVCEEILNEEKETDELLTQIAENNINYEAAKEAGEA